MRNLNLLSEEQRNEYNMSRSRGVSDSLDDDGGLKDLIGSQLVSVPLNYTSVPDVSLYSLSVPTTQLSIVLPTIPINTWSQRRDASDINATEPSTKRSACNDIIIDALQQTVIPDVPQSVEAEVRPLTPPLLNSITPTIDFFSNEIIYYSNGVVERPDVVDLFESEMPMLSTFLQDILIGDEDDESDIEWVYSDQSDSMVVLPENEQELEHERDETKSECLKSYNCPICYETPCSPVSTTCGHIYCEKCIKRLFKLKCKKWKCPQCRQSLFPSDYHPIYLP